MAANTEMSRLDSLPTETLNSLIALAESLPTSITNPQDGDTLVYDGESNKWKNGEGGGGGGGGSFIVNITEWTSETEFAVDKTAQEIYDAAQSGLNPVLVEKYEEGEGDISINQIPLSAASREEEEDGVVIYVAVFSGFSPQGRAMYVNQSIVLSEGDNPTTGTFSRNLTMFVPSPENADAGDVLTLNDSMSPEWQTP